MNARLHANWTAADLDADRSWIFPLDDGSCNNLEREVKRLFVADKPLFDYKASDVDLGRAASLISEAFSTALNGCGIALVTGLPRERLDEEEFAFLT